MDDNIINAALARVLVSTDTKKRQFSIFDVAEDLTLLKNTKGGMQEVAKIIGISAGMLNQFISIYKLPDDVLALVKSRQIDSVSVVHNLTKFNDNDSRELANFVIKKELSNQDLRILLPYRKQYPNTSIIELVKKIKESKNIKVSVIRFAIKDLKTNIDSLKNKISNLIGEDNFLTIQTNESSYDIKVTAKGEAILREIARKNKTTFKDLIFQFIQ